MRVLRWQLKVHEVYLFQRVTWGAVVVFSTFDQVFNWFNVYFLCLLVSVLCITAAAAAAAEFLVNGSKHHAMQLLFIPAAVIIATDYY